MTSREFLSTNVNPESSVSNENEMKKGKQEVENSGLEAALKELFTRKEEEKYIQELLDVNKKGEEAREILRGMPLEQQELVEDRIAISYGKLIFETTGEASSSESRELSSIRYLSAALTSKLMTESPSFFKAKDEEEDNGRKIADEVASAIVKQEILFGIKNGDLEKRWFVKILK